MVFSCFAVGAIEEDETAHGKFSTGNNSGVFEKGYSWILQATARDAPAWAWRLPHCVIPASLAPVAFATLGSNLKYRTRIKTASTSLYNEKNPSVAERREGTEARRSRAQQNEPSSPHGKLVVE